MSTINITNTRKNLFQLLAFTNVDFNPITIVNNIRKNKNWSEAKEFNPDEKC